MRILVRFDVVNPPQVGQATDYSAAPALGLHVNVVSGRLTALLVEVEIDDEATVAEISLVAREKLRNLITASITASATCGHAV
jgi:hypothetical protein